MWNTLEKIEDSSLKNSRSSFLSKEYLMWLRGPYVEQRIIKNWFLSKYFNVEDEKTLKKINKEHFFNGEFFSSSYSDHRILFMVADKKIGVDIEKIRERSPIMLDWFSMDDYAILGNGKNWESFFILWTAEEALLKAIDAEYIEEAQNFKFLSAEKKEEVFDTLLFQWLLKIEYKGRNYSIYSWNHKWKIIYSICFKD